MQDLSLNEATRNVVVEESGEPDHCLVCYNTLEYTTKTPCDHNEVCGVCHLRLRFLHQDKKCPICKADNEQVVVDVPGKPFDQYNVWGNDLGANYEYREDVGIFFLKDYYNKEVKPLFGFHCTKKDCRYDGLTPDANIYEKDANGNPTKPKSASPIRALQDHLRNKHQMTLCQLCVDHKRDFVARLPRFTPAQLKKHLANGDGKGSGFEGHPICEFCRPTRFYDITHLHVHLNKEHYKCHVCEKQGLANQFFKNYKSLERHFDNQHFLCHDVQCLTARFMVFENELDLRHHERQVHGGTSSSKIQLEFRVRRQVEENQEVPNESDFNYGLDGQAFVPADLPQSSDAVNLHPRHVERTEQLRQQAQMIRQNSSQSSLEAFPDLAGNTDTQTAEAAGPLRVGWTSGTALDRLGGRKKAGEVTDEDFPTLPAAPKKKNTLIKMRPASSRAPLSSGGWSEGVSQTVVGRPVSSFPSIPSAAGRSASLQAQRVPSSEEFPSLGGPVGGPKKKYAAEAFARKTQPPPSWSDADFPAPSVGSSSNSSIRNKMLGGSSATGAHVASANVLQQPSTASKATVDDIKAILGPAKYKQLKAHVKSFSSQELGPQEFIDHTAFLFERGYADRDFWSFTSGLLESFPDEYRARQAMAYMEELKRMKNGAQNMESLKQAQAPASSSWASRPKVALSSTPAGARVAPALNFQNQNGQGGGWQKPAGVSMTQRRQPVVSNSTQQQTSSGSSNNTKKKKKKNDDLRKLAFG